MNKDGFYAISKNSITKDKSRATVFSMGDAKKVKYALNKNSGGWRIYDERRDS